MEIANIIQTLSLVNCKVKYQDTGRCGACNELYSGVHPYDRGAA